jgi:hypothetical protein
MVAFIKTHGGLDLDEFYDEHAESEVTDIIVEYTKMLLAAVKDDDNKAKLEGLAKKLTPSKKSSCKKKDPDAPKRGKSSYIFFTQEHREKAKKELMKEHGDDFENKMVMSRLGEMWSALKASTKAKDKKEVEKFEKMAADDKERYQAEKEDYTPPSEEELSEKLSSKKKRKDPNAPKRGKSAYIFFTQEHREKAKKELMEEHGDDFENKMVMSRLGELWNEMKESTKPKDKKAVARFEKMAVDDKERYQAEMADYTPPSTDEDEPPKKKAAKKPSPKKEVAKKPSPKKEVAKKPSPKKEVAKKPSPKKAAGGKANAKTGFALWKKEKEEEIKEDFPKLTQAKFLAKCVELWKEVDEKEKQEWAEAEEEEGEEEEGEEEEGEGEEEEGEGEEEEGEGEEEEEVEEEEGDY